METKQWRYLDKESWPKGVWDDEVDKMQWVDEAPGLPCLIVRTPYGHLCGYVAVDKSSPFYGREVSSLREIFSVHGGITLADHEDSFDGNGQIRFCELDVIEPWLIGFDCGHKFDYSPEATKFDFAPRDPNRYRTFEYVKNEVTQLAHQIKTLPETYLTCPDCTSVFSAQWKLARHNKRAHTVTV
jgi:hypothetical protein